MQASNKIAVAGSLERNRSSAQGLRTELLHTNEADRHLFAGTMQQARPESLAMIGRGKASARNGERGP
jgi:hypothetical protein